jgi:hypothetical protein
MILLSDVVIFLSSIAILSRNGQFSDCAIISFSEQHEDAVDTPALFQPHLKIRISLRDGRSVQELHVRSKDSIIERGSEFPFRCGGLLDKPTDVHAFRTSPSLTESKQFTIVKPACLWVITQQ